jgi:hypothetical protein
MKMVWTSCRHIRVVTHAVDGGQLSFKVRVAHEGELMLVLDLCEGICWFCHLDFTCRDPRDLNFRHPETHSRVVLAAWHVLYQLPRIVVVSEAPLVDVSTSFAFCDLRLHKPVEIFDPPVMCVFLVLDDQQVTMIRFLVIYHLKRIDLVVLIQRKYIDGDIIITLKLVEDLDGCGEADVFPRLFFQWYRF